MLLVCAKSIYARFCLTLSSISNVVYYSIIGALYEIVLHRKYRQLSAVLKELGDMENQDDEGRLRELIDALWCADDEEGKVKK